ncbi:prolyl oligopeptidase family serine peptidase [Kribbella sp. NPDC051586]|uniref:prolyl oligopeptidase family serine peptidase n=1 Tax=Kribbella sp. NPDC051586 TaxID=3364118 RepID=UPI00379A25E7
MPCSRSPSPPQGPHGPQTCGGDRPWVGPLWICGSGRCDGGGVTCSDLMCLRDICYARPDGVELCLDVVGPAPLPSDPVPVAVRVDGCPGWGPGDRGAAMLPFVNPAMARAGFLAVGISVRHSGQAIFPAQLEDVQAAVRWLRRNPLGLPVNPERIGIWGQSAGGHLAAMAGAKPSGTPGDEVQAVVTISGPSDLTRPGGDMRIDRPSPVTALVGGVRPEQLRAASPVAYVTTGAPPYLIIHGTRDETVPYEQGELLHRALLAAGADSRLVPIAGGHHNLLDDPDAPYDGQVWYDVANEAARFFQRHLGVGQGSAART